jgi:hypothetical protein
MRTKFGAMVLMAAALGGCASTTNIIGDPFSSPRKFQYLRCEDIAKAMATSERREKELHDLMDRVGGGVGGSTVNVLVYGPDLRQVEADLRQLRESAGEKRCSDEVLKTAPTADIVPLR